MAKKITINIKCCRDCPLSTNSSIEHDCAFTSAPHPMIWYCTHPNREAPFGEKIIRDEYQIDEYCPL